MRMVAVLAIEIVLALLFSLIMGLMLVGRQRIGRFLAHCLPSWLMVLIVAIALQSFRLLNFDALSPLDMKLPPGTLGMLWVILETAIWLAPLIAWLNAVFEFDANAALMAISSITINIAFHPAILVGLAGVAAIGLQLFWRWAGQGLLLGILVFLAEILILNSIWSLTRLPNFKRVVRIWGLFWIILGAGYVIAGRWGLIFLSLLLGLWIYFKALETFSGHVLPVSREQRPKVFRAALSYLLGSNYPFYVIRDWHNSSNAQDALPKPTTPGNPFLQFFAGPGIIVTDCVHAAVLNDGIKYRVAPPGVTFTNIFEQLFAAVDLRPQLRVTTIPAETKDGILTKTLVFMPHRIDTGGETPAVGKSFPYNEQAILKAVTQEAYVEHSWSRDESGKATEVVKRVPWDELVLMIGPAVFKDVLVKYTGNELHDTKSGQRDPRVEIGNAFRNQLKERMREFGIELVGGGLSNIVPDRSVVEQRIANWSARWKNQIEKEMGQAEAEVTKMLESIWLEAQLDVYQELAKILERAGALSEDAIALQLVEALGAIPPKEVSERPEEALPEFIRALVRRSK